MTFEFIFLTLLITLATLYLRKFVAAKAENLAQKQDLKDLTMIVERVKSQFERANAMHKLQLETEFSACVNTWREASLAHKEFSRIHLATRVSSELVKEHIAKRAKLFTHAQHKFTDTLRANQPFMREDVWKAFADLELALTAWRDSSERVPSPLQSEARERARRALDECNRRIKNRFAGEVYLSGMSDVTDLSSSSMANRNTLH
jgi:hypothetical protein